MSQKEKGQTLVLIVILSLVALLIGVTISDRFIKSFRSITASDDSSKAVSIAEAAIENILLLPNETLLSFINSPGTCGSNCYYEVVDTNGQVISATINLSKSGGDSLPYSMNVTQEDSNELLLEGYPSGQNLSVCWNGDASIFAQYIYNESATVTKMKTYAYNSLLSVYTTNGFEDALSGIGVCGYENYFTITATNTPKILRIKSFYEDVDVVVIPAPGQIIPQQGILIESIGTAGDAIRTVQVVKSEPHLPSVFNNILYQKSLSEPLSN